MMSGCYQKFFKYFINNKKLLFKYTILSCIVGVLELFGVALTYPFINKLLTGSSKYSLIFGTLIIVAFLAKNLFMIFYNSLQVKFTKNCETQISLKFMHYFLNGNYQDICRIPFAQKQQILTYLIPNSINNYLIRILNLYVNFFIFGLITAFLFIKFFKATVITLICSFIMLSAQYIFFKNKTRQIAAEINDIGEETNRICNEALLNLKNVKIMNGEGYFFNKYSQNFNILKDLTGRLLFYNTIPPYVTEPFIIILLVILLSIITLDTFSNPASLVASYAVIVTAIFRLAPTLSRIQVNLTSLQSTLPLVRKLVEYYEACNISASLTAKTSDKQTLNQSLELRNISFSYKDKPVLKNISFKINKGEFIGIAGISGAGKTTLADIISGLLIPQSGDILIDNSSISHPNLKIGYIPQEYTIISASIRENVAFGNTNIDDNKVIDALKKAALYDYIQTNFPDGIYSKPFVDGRGFSQGQKQRLAIARTLYPDPDIIILDEATSSLDLKTEDEICNVLNLLKGNKTIIAIAHRLSTLKSADRIIFMKEAEIIDIAPFDELLYSNSDFRNLAELNSSNLIH